MSQHSRMVLPLPLVVPILPFPETFQIGMVSCHAVYRVAGSASQDALECRRATYGVFLEAQNPDIAKESMAWLTN